MTDELKSQSGGEKTPEQELAELLRQSQAKPLFGRSAPAMSPKPRVLAPGLGIPAARQLPKINWLAMAIGALALVLVFGTGYFLLSSLKFNTGEITLELNESQVKLAVDEKEYDSTIDSNYVLRLKTGTHQIRLSKDGFLELQKSVEIKRGDKQLLSLELLPIPAIEQVLAGSNIEFSRLNQDGSEVSYFDTDDKYFKSIQLKDRQIVNLFRGNFPDTVLAVWAPVGQAALVKLTGRHSFQGLIDNRDLLGRYVVLGDRPPQGKPNYNGVTTWLFDDDRRTSAGWTPILMNDSIRQIAFGPGGSEAIYIYETADGEYSLIRALPDGQEWERAVTDMPRLSSSATIEWANDEQHVLINNESKLLLVDIVAKTVSEIASDWLVGSAYSLSPAGDRLVYIAKVGDQTKLVMYDFITSEVKPIEAAEVMGTTKFTWIGDSQLVIVGQNKSFTKFDIETGDKVIIPFVGTDTDFQITELAYSQAARLLMLVTDKGIFTMKMV
jgi:hypothetical protein